MPLCKRYVTWSLGGSLFNSRNGGDTMFTLAIDLAVARGDVPLGHQRFTLNSAQVVTNCSVVYGVLNETEANLPCILAINKDACCLLGSKRGCSRLSKGLIP